MLALAPPWFASAAAAQLAGSAALTTDYRLRGLSLTDRRPALSLGVAYDHPSGVYGGASLVVHDPERKGPRVLGGQVYVGVAGRFADGTGWDVGVNRLDMNPYFDREYSIEYTEIYGGLSHGPLSGRVAVAPNYPRRGATTAYAELNGASRPADGWRLTAHVGARASEGETTRFDASLGVVREMPRGELYLSVVGVTPRPEPQTSLSRPGLMAGLTVFF